MGFLNKIFGNTKTKDESKSSNVHWIALTTLEQLEEIKELSKNEYIVLFKHSTRCGISRMVIKQFENSFDESMRSLKVYYLDLLTYREISNKVAEMFQVLHQSPQILVIKDKVAQTFASHYDITTVDYKKFS